MVFGSQFFCGVAGIRMPVVHFISLPIISRLRQAAWLKVDPHYTPAGDFCESQGNTDPRGCFVLLHNTPSNSEVWAQGAGEQAS